FANLVTLRFHFDPQLSFRSWLIKVRQLITDTQAHALLPYEMLCEHMRGEGVEPPEIRAIFNFLGPQSANRVGDLILAPRPVSRKPAMPWGMSVLVKRDVDDNRINFSFDAGIYDPQGVEQLADSFLRLLDGVTRCPDDPMHSCEWWQSGPGEMRQTEG
ncbi:MAG TPA: hypothetical protein VK956_15275, partial [Verrucomicrobium sp.]|nr:hypothetical protein [Verrucomicrobium sp.]